MLDQTFTLARIGEVLDMDPGTLRNHINRGLVVGQGPRDSQSKNKPKGKHARFSFFTLMEFALAYRLNNMGVELSKAFQFASHFAHAGGGGAIFDLPERLPGLPYHHDHGDTVFAAGINGNTFEALDENTSLYSDLKRHLHCDDFIIVNVTQLFFQICQRIGDIHPLEALDTIYSKVEG